MGGRERFGREIHKVGEESGVSLRYTERKSRKNGRQRIRSKQRGR